jgi:3-oxoacyl-[acyl-carrier-protein] synthase II
MTAPPDDGRGAALAMSNAIADAEINSSDIDYINAHGTSTPLGDVAETIALKSVFGENVPQISSTKSMTGHTLGAAGAIESIFCIKVINEGIIPPTINLENPDPLCDLNYTPLTSINKKVNIAMNNSFGFGGTNSTLVFKKI